ncbi:atrial natriuretic peptide receptor 3-like isoform X1 [Paramacrobiotus metropolitanus]|uniref:atrial natriuretic peptide receptor 3-like isoform X1 n=1 Tax=Paramacrobiotus metropolitanus TaxID=2943436 RepID=UPI002446556C|nr:atrial natriuretic peptide receptor 3-like isoform X1 [Paramacrobiotus metropolitanus]
MESYRRSSLRLVVWIFLFTGFSSSTAQAKILVLEYSGSGSGAFNHVLDIAAEHLGTSYWTQLNLTRLRITTLNRNPMLYCEELETDAVAWISEFYYRRKEPDISGLAIIAPEICLSTSKTISYMAKEWNIPVFSPSIHFSVRENDKRSDYSTLTRIAPFDDREMIKFIYNVLTKFNCTTCPVAVLCDDDYDRENRQRRFTLSTCLALKYGLSDWYRISATSFNVNTTNTLAVRQTLTKASAIAKVIFLAIPGDRVRAVMLAALDQGLTGAEYLYFTVQPWHDTNLFGNVTWFSKTEPERNADAQNAFSSLFTISTRSEDTPEFWNLTGEVKKSILSDKQHGAIWPKQEVDPFVMSYYYTLAIFGQVLNETLTNGGNLSDGAALCKLMWNRSYTILGNEIVINANGDRTVDWVVSQMDSAGNFMPVMEYSARDQQFRSSRDPVGGSVRQIVWPNKRARMPVKEGPLKCDSGGTNDGCTVLDASTEQPASQQPGTSMLLYTALNSTAEWLSRLVPILQQFRQALRI